MLDKVSVSWEQATFKCHLEVVYYALCHQSSSHHNDVRMIIITTVVRQAEKSLKYQSQIFWRAAQLTGMIVNSKARKQEKEGNLAVDRQMLNVCIIFWLTEIELRLPGIFIHSSTAVGTRILVIPDGRRSLLILIHLLSFSTTFVLHEITIIIITHAPKNKYLWKLCGSWPWQGFWYIALSYSRSFATIILSNASPSRWTLHTMLFVIVSMIIRNV